MLNNTLINKPTKRLFLICPTDSIEQPILRNFSGQAFYYTALGAYLEYDFNVEYKLWELICEHRIEAVVFATSINNVFFADVFDKNIKHNYPVDKALTKAKKKISNPEIPDVFNSNYHLLAVQYLKNQKQRLLDTHFLGRRLKEEQIIVDSYIYHPFKNSFCDIKETEKMGHLLKNVSYN